jgi:hypothetical protein
VTANDLARSYGADNPSLGWTVGGMGLINGDTLSGTLFTAASRSSDGGQYAITNGSLTASANYNLAFQPGTLTVEMLRCMPAGTSASNVG